MPGQDAGSLGRPFATPCAKEAGCFGESLSMRLDPPLPKAVNFFEFPETSAARIREYLCEGARDPNLDTGNGSAQGPLF
jgi:hypothetical protein